jgi:O-antigen/teichoic acid export membrane protein
MNSSSPAALIPGSSEVVPGRGEKHARSIFWGFIDQGLSSLTNFTLTLVAGRLLGPAGLGTIVVGFSVYLLALGLQRRLLTEPMLSSTAAASSDGWSDTCGRAFTLCLAAAVTVAVAIALAGLMIPGFIGRGLFLIAPWLVPALLQDLWRNILFAERRSVSAAMNDGVWVLAMGAAIPAALILRSGWSVIGAWGAGAVAASLVGIVQTKVSPRHPIGAWRWWKADAWPFGRWNASAAIVTNVGTQASTLVLSTILGASSVGGLRAAHSLFAPLTLITPAIALPGLPAIMRARTAGERHGRRLALKLSLVALAAASAFIIALALGAWRLLPFLFGDEFSDYKELLWPIAFGQVFLAISVGYLTLLRAQRRGQALLKTRLVAMVVTLCMVTTFAWQFGLVGAAWGAALGSFVAAIILVVSALSKEATAQKPSQEVVD